MKKIVCTLAIVFATSTFVTVNNAEADWWGDLQKNVSNAAEQAKKNAEEFARNAKNAADQAGKVAGDVGKAAARAATQAAMVRRSLKGY
ncbi:MAG: hypothetical protein GY915_07525 [bacterium]|nr:hypothetical protein [bacterium]